MTSNHQYANATLIAPDGSGTFDPGFQNTATGYDDPETAPPGITLPAGTFRAMWFTYVPATSAINVEVDTIAINSTGQAISPVYLSLYSVTGGVWTVIAEQNNTGWIYYQPWSVTAGTTYYLRTASSDSTAGQIRLLAVRAPVAGTATPAPPVVDTSAHQYATAAALVPNGSGVADTGLVTVSTGFDQNEISPPGVTLSAGSRAYWNTFVPSSTGNIHIEAIAVNAGGSVVPVTLTAWQVDAGVWTQTGSATNAAGYATMDPLPVTAGKRSYVRMSSSDATVAQYRLIGVNMSPPATEAPTNPTTNDTTAHQYANAVALAPDSNGTSDSGLVTVSTGFDQGENAPPGTTLSGYRAYWHTFLPFSTASVHVEAVAVNANGNTVSVTLTAWQVDAGVWTQIGTATNASGYAIIDPLTMTAGKRTYLRMSSAEPAVAQYRLIGLRLPLKPIGQPTQLVPIDVDLSLPVPTPSWPHAQLQPFDVTVAVAGTILGQAVTAELGPLDVTVGIGGISDAANLPQIDAPPIRSGARVRAAALRRLTYGLLEPDDGSILPVNPAQLSGYVAYAEGDVDSFDVIRVDFQYGTYVEATNTWTPVAIVSDDDVDILAGYTTAEAATGTLDPSKQYAWRMRLVVDGLQRTWTGFRQFSIGGPATTAAVLPVHAMISSLPTYPHLWYIEPPVGAPGEHVTLIGQGFPLNTPTVSFGDQLLEIVSVAQVAASPDAALDTRLIAELDIDCEHDEIVVVVPDTEEPGASVIVGGN